MAFKEPGGLLSLLYELQIGPYLEQDISSLQHLSPPPSNPLSYHPPICISTSLKVCFCRVFLLNSVCISGLFHMCFVPCPSQCSWLKISNYVRQRVHYAFSSELCNFIHSLVFSSLLCPVSRTWDIGSTAISIG